MKKIGIGLVDSLDFLEKIQLCYYYSFSCYYLAEFCFYCTFLSVAASLREAYRSQSGLYSSYLKIGY